MARRIRDQVVLITGPARGIGAATARKLAAHGARLALVGMEADRLHALASELGSEHHWHECDVTDQQSLEAAVADTAERLGRIDVVIANAGIASNGTVATTDVEVLARVIDVNLVGVMRTVKATLPHVTASRGYFLLVSSAAAFSAMPGLAAYGPSKAGVEQFAKALRIEVEPLGIDVCSAHMSWIDTDLVRNVQRDISAFARVVRTLPGPFGVTTSLDACAEAFVHAVATRSRTLFVPSTLGPMSAMRQLLGSATVQRFMRPKLAPMTAPSATSLSGPTGAFGEHSVGMGKPRT